MVGKTYYQLSGTLKRHAKLLCHLVKLLVSLYGALCF